MKAEPAHLEEKQRNEINDLTDLFQRMLGPEVKVDRITVSDKFRRVDIYAHSITESGICPHCGTVTVKRKDTYTRNLQEIPLLPGYRTTEHIKINRWLCPHCHHSFNEQISVAYRYQHQTANLQEHIFNISAYQNACQAHRTLLYEGISISDGTITRTSKLAVKETMDAETVIGIDDISKKRGMTFNTVACSGDSHRYLGMTPGRDKESADQILEMFPGAEVVARDRSSSYGNSIREEHPEITQCADRFHISANIIGRTDKYLKQELPDGVTVIGSTVLEGDQRAMARSLEKTAEPFYDNSPVLDDQGKEIHIVARCLDAGSHAIKQLNQKKAAKQHLVREIRNFCATTDNPHPIAAAVRKFGVSRTRVKHYVSMTEDEVEKSGSVRTIQRREKPIDGYKNIIYKMLRDGYGRASIEKYILEAGYDGGSSNLEYYIRYIAKTYLGKKRCPRKDTLKKLKSGCVYLSAEEVIRILTVSKTWKVKKMEKQGLMGCREALLACNIPAIRTFVSLWSEYKKMWSDRNAAALGPFLEHCKGTYLKSFAEYLEKNDMAAVQNAISSGVNSGFVEGNNNLLKLVKRLFFGRAGDQLLDLKMYTISLCNKTDLKPFTVMSKWIESKRRVCYPRDARVTG